MKIGKREPDHQYAPGSKFVHHMRQVKIKWLGPMDRFAKAPYEFAHDDLIEEARLRQNPADHPQKKDTERSEPWPPAAPRAVAAGVSPASPLKQRNARKQKRINNRSLDQHCDREQCKHVKSISRFPRFLFSDFSPDQQADQKNHERQRHVCAHECCQAWTKQIQSERPKGNQASNRSVSQSRSAKQKNRYRN